MIACGLAGGALLTATAPAQRGQPAPVPAAVRVPFQQVWDQPIGMPGPLAIAVNAARIFVTSGETGIEARSASDGLLAWMRETPSALAPVATRDLVFVAAAAGLVALHEGTGTDRWTRDAGGPITALAGAGAGVITVAGALVRAWAADGAMTWERTLPAPVVPERIAVDGDQVYAGLEDATLVGLAAATGSPRWTARLDGVARALSAKNGRVYFGTDRPSLCAYHQRGGEVWCYQRTSVIGAPAVDDRFVYAALWDNTIVAHTADHGHLEWRAPLDGRPASGPLLSGDLVVAPLLSADFTGLARKSGLAVTPAAAADAPSGRGLLAVTLAPDATRVFVVMSLRNASRRIVSLTRPD
jgi:outer membrane protein assembly factor BamB